MAAARPRALGLVAADTVQAAGAAAMVLAVGMAAQASGMAMGAGVSAARSPPE